MRSGIKAIAALALLSGCGTDANGADKAGNAGDAVGAASATSTATGAVQAVPPNNAYVHPPVPAGFTLLSEAEVTDLLMSAESISVGKGIGYSWRFNFNTGTVRVVFYGGIVPSQGSDKSFRIYPGGQVCVPADAERMDRRSCFYIVKKNSNKRFYVFHCFLDCISDFSEKRIQFYAANISMRK